MSGSALDGTEPSGAGHSAVGAVGALARAGAREYRRAPVLLALLVALPAYVIGLFSVVIPATDVGFSVAGEPVATTLTTAATAFTTPMVAALLAGIAGLFLMSGVENDGRLLVAGYRAHEVILGRLGLLALVSLVATAVPVGVMLLTYRPEATGAFVLAVWLTAVVYGMGGVVVGTRLDRLPGVYLVLFGAMVDLFLFQNPLASDSPAFAPALPGHFPMSVAMEAAFVGTVDWTGIAYSALVLVVATLLATLVYRRAMAT